ncbi:MAG: amino acid permease [Parachlamydiaceae bacterium]|nr:amino acid permease [Parachlamydiaceae bacterium]
MGILTRKTLESVDEASEANKNQLKRVLGPFQLILFGIGAIVGAGLFSITGIAAAEHAGPAILLSFLIAAIGCAFAGLCYSELASMIPIAGSAYTYAYITMGELTAWMIGWTLILEYAIGAATVSISWSAYLISFLHDVGIDLPVALIASPWNPTPLPDGTLATGIINLPALMIVIIASCVLIMGIKNSAYVNAVIVSLKIGVILIFIAVGIQYINFENYSPFIPENEGTFGTFGWSGIFRAAGIIFFAYIGFDSVSTASQETINPQKNMPRGILGSLVICTILYVLFAFVMLGLVSYTRLGVAAPVALAIDQTPYPWLSWAIKLAILAGFTSVILVLLLGQSRIFYAMAHDGLLPPFFARVHPKWKTPWGASLILVPLVGLVSAFAPLSVVGNMTSIGTLLAFSLVCAGVLILRYTHPEYPRAFRVPFVPLFPLLGIATCMIMMFSLNVETWLRLILWLAIGLLLYYFYSRHHAIAK